MPPPDHRFVKVYEPDQTIARNPEGRGGPVDVVRLIAVEDNGQRWGFVRRLWQSTVRGGVGREEDRGWVRLPSAFIEDETFDTSRRQVPTET